MGGPSFWSRIADRPLAAPSGRLPRSDRASVKTVTLTVGSITQMPCGGRERHGLWTKAKPPGRQPLRRLCLCPNCPQRRRQRQFLVRITTPGVIFPTDKFRVFCCDSAGTAMRTLAEYQSNAAECWKLAKLMAKPEDKHALERMAQIWEKLAKSQVDLSDDV